MSQNLTQQDKNFLREKFIHKYCKEKGWNPNELSTNQMLSIIKQTGYKNPKLDLK